MITKLVMGTAASSVVSLAAVRTGTIRAVGNNCHLLVQSRSTQHLAAIKQLRKVTNGGIVECKEALKKCNWDLDAAILHIRQLQQACELEVDAEKPLFGKIAVSKNLVGEEESVIVELNCNCDFITSSERFAQLSHSIRDSIQQAIRSKRIGVGHTSETGGVLPIDVETCNDVVLDTDDGTTVGQMLQRASAEYKRKIVLSNVLLFRRLLGFDYGGMYLHQKSRTAEGLIGTRLGLVSVTYEPGECTSHIRVSEQLERIAKCLAVQLVAVPLEPGQAGPEETKGRNTIMRLLLEQTWLQIDEIQPSVSGICKASSRVEAKLNSGTTVGKTFDGLRDALSARRLCVSSALCMRTTDKPIILQ
ncbi:elongation factor Ts, mitochondrial-like [Babesia caballi]|uniref:Elongation factor Ts, mitochondrial-like n=1 Tax=Babesia caballi TaxID=5871 RepID=A0AAV4LMN5_BABCB|nr:elongation factor Ts, mitochondrial-like [Babesia caballi]